MVISRRKIAVLAAVGLAIGVSQATSLEARTWSIGREQEVDEGYYLTLIDSRSGWRLWKIETENGVECKAIKSAKGRTHPQPVGVADLFYGGAPYVEVSVGIQIGKSEPLYRFRLRGTYGSGRISKYRTIREKFWTDWHTTTDLTPFDGESIEVHIVTHEYDAIHVGRVEDNGILDLTGLAGMIERVSSCSSG